MRRRHRMPYGAEPSDDSTRFRIWAPACERVELRLGDALDAGAAMTPLGDGWHEARIAAPPGTSYAFGVDGGAPVPDPASRANPRDVDGPSRVVDPHAFDWPDAGWTGRPWREAVIYEMHVGTFTPEGTFAAAIERLPHLAALGITAIELMPLADFAGRRNWGYDGVLPFAPDNAYGTPEELKRLVAAAHAHGLMVLLDVVYNHFGPVGNHLARYAPAFFDTGRSTPWGPAIDFERARPVREFFVHNALYWLEEFHMDGLRLDAVHAIEDRSPRHIVEEIAAAIDAGPRREREVHLVLENARNDTRFVDTAAASRATAQWNDDWHHAAHVLLTGERDGYYEEFAERPAQLLARALAEGFVKGGPSAHLAPERFVAFLQNHDQVGNRAFGDRLAQSLDPRVLDAARALLLLAPSIPLVFMGDEWAERRPFLFFCDFDGGLAQAVREGRRREFARFPQFADEASRSRIPDPNDEATFLASKLDWEAARREPGRRVLEATRELLRMRRQHVVPHLNGERVEASCECFGEAGVAAQWRFADGKRVRLRVDLAPSTAGWWLET